MQAKARRQGRRRVHHLVGRRATTRRPLINKRPWSATEVSKNPIHVVHISLGSICFVVLQHVIDNNAEGTGNIRMQLGTVHCFQGDNLLRETMVCSAGQLAQRELRTTVVENIAAYSAGRSPGLRMLCECCANAGVYHCATSRNCN